MIKTCGQCNNEFWAVHIHNKFCSTKCAGLAKTKPRIEGDCKHCGKHFVTDYTTTNWQYTHRIKERSYCSAECRIAGNHKDKAECSCEICGTKFLAWKNDIEKYGRGRFCSRLCYHKYNSGEKHHNWKGGISPQVEKDRKAAGSKPWRNAVLKRDGYKCIWCGVTERLEVDHIMPWSIFPRLRFEVSNGRTLCHDCHVKTPTYGAKTK